MMIAKLLLMPRAGVLNPLTRKIVFVRACVRPSVRPCVPHFLIMILQLFERNFLFKKGTFSTKNSEIEAHFLIEKGAFFFLFFEL